MFRVAERKRKAAEKKKQREENRGAKEVAEEYVFFIHIST